MAKLPFGKKEREKGFRMISVVNLTPDLTIDDPRAFLKEMRSTFLKKAREAKGLTKEEVSQKCMVSLSILEKVESGKIDEQDMMLLHTLSEIYEVDYYSLLFLYKLAKRPDRTKVEKASRIS